MKSGAVVIRPWQEGDFALLAEAAPGLSARTLYLRFRAGMPSLPATYLRSTQQRWPARWDAVVAIVGDQLVGWAEFGRYIDDPDRADIGMCVVDAEQGHGIGTALAAALIGHAREAGLVSVHADIEPDNDVARRAWARATGSPGPTFALAHRPVRSTSRPPVAVA
jgi:RimJ/RimL family protein N-acetyltransferase